MNIKMDYLKDKYIETREKELDEWRKRGDWNHNRYTAIDIANLRDMAEMDVYPDGRFGDEECNIWSMFHCFSMKVKKS